MRLPRLALSDLIDGHAWLEGFVTASQKGRAWYDFPTCWARHGAVYSDFLSVITFDEVIISHYMPSAHSADSFAFVVSCLMRPLALIGLLHDDSLAQTFPDLLQVRGNLGEID